MKWCGCAFGTAYKAVALEHRTAGSRFIGGFEDRMKAFDNRDEEEIFQVQLPQLAAELLRRGITSHDKYDFEEGSVRFNAYVMLHHGPWPGLIVLVPRCEASLRT